MIKLQCVINEWIRLDELYKLMESFQISESFFELFTFFLNSGVGFKQARCIHNPQLNNTSLFFTHEIKCCINLSRTIYYIYVILYHSHLLPGANVAILQECLLKDCSLIKKRAYSKLFIIVTIILIGENQFSFLLCPSCFQELN